jgi:mannosyltransferase
MSRHRDRVINTGLPGREQWFVISAIVFLGLALRLYQIGAENLWTDEWLSLGDAGDLRFYNRHRPLFFLVLHRWSQCLSVTGLLQTGDGWLRLLAVFFGIAAVILLYLLAHRLAGAAVAMVASLIMVVAVPELDHSQEVRMYTMASALTLASLYLLVGWIDGGKLATLGLHLLFTLLAILTTPTVISGLLLAGVMGAILVLRRRSWPGAAAMLIGYGLILAVWWPLSRYAWAAIKVGQLDWIPQPSRTALLFLHGELLSEGLGMVRDFQPSHPFQAGLSLLSLGLVAAALIAAWRSQSASQWTGSIAAWFYAIALGMYAISVLKRPVWILRYFHYAAPAFYLLLGIGIVALWRWRRPVGWIAGATLLGMTSLAAVDYYRLPMHENWRGAAATVASEATGDDNVAIAGHAALFNRYYRRYQGRGNVCQIIPRISEGSRQEDALLADLVGQIPAGKGRAWVVVREDPRFERVAFLERLEHYLRQLGTVPRVRIFRAMQGQIDLIDFVPSAERATASIEPTSETRTR